MHEPTPTGNPLSEKARNSPKRRLLFVAVSILVALAIFAVWVFYPADVSGDSWGSFIDLPRGYRVQMPSKPTRRTDTRKAGFNDAAIRAEVFSCSQGGIKYSIAYKHPLDRVVMNLAIERDVLAKQMRGTISNLGDCPKLDGWRGIDYQVNTLMSCSRVRQYLIANQVYELVVTAYREGQAQAAAETFFGSFEILTPARYLCGIDPMRAATVDSKANLVLTAGQDNKLRIYTYPDFQERDSYTLTRPATHMTLNSATGQLYVVAGTQPKKFEHKPDPVPAIFEASDLEVYDAQPLLAGTHPKKAPLPLLKTIPLQLPVAQLALAGQGKWLFYLEKVSDKSKVRLGRVNTLTFEKQELTLCPGTEDLCTDRQDSVLYVSASPKGHQYHVPRENPDTPPDLEGKIQVVSLDPFRLSETFDFNGDPFSIRSSAKGYLYSGGGSNQHTDLIRLDPTTRKMVDRLKPYYMLSPFALTPDDRWLIVANHASSWPGRITLFHVLEQDQRKKFIPSPQPHTPRTQGGALLPAGEFADRKGQYGKGVGSEFVLTPDGKTVIFLNGGVLRLNLQELDGWLADE